MVILVLNMCRESEIANKLFIKLQQRDKTIVEHKSAVLKANVSYVCLLGARPIFGAAATRATAHSF